MSNLLFWGGGIILLQPGCSKEKAENAEKYLKSSSTLEQSNNDILYFLEEYQKWIDEESYTYGELTLEDAEWILEAALNHSNQFPPEHYGQYAILEYEDDNEVILNANPDNHRIPANHLFNSFHGLIILTESYTDVAPASDIEIIGDGPEFVIITKIARVNKLAPEPFDLSKKAYPQSVWSCFSTSPNKPSYPGCYGNLNQDVGWDLLDYNLKREKGVIGVQSGKYVNVQTWTYPKQTISLVNSDYEGEYTYADYSLKIWGATPTANPNTTSTGSKGECISDTEMQYYEDEISLLMDTEKPSGNKVTMVKVTSNYDHATSHIEPAHLPGLWNYHQVIFSEAIHIP